MILGLLFLACLVALFIGILKPALVIRWGTKEKKNRKTVLKVYGLGLLGLLVLSAMFSPDIEDSNDGGVDPLVSENAMAEEAIKSNEFPSVYANPEKYKGRSVEFYGRIFLEPERDDKGTYLQMYTQNQGGDGNTLVAIKDPNLDVKDGDIVFVKGIVSEVYEGENLFGAKITAPTVVAQSVEVTDYVTAFSPVIKSIEVNQEINQNGYCMTLQRVELSEFETRAYLKIQNNSSDEISFYSYSSVMTQGTSQSDTQSNYDADYQEILDDILPGVVSEGVVVFNPVNIDGENIKLIFKGGSDDYSLDFEPFTFEVVISE